MFKQICFFRKRADMTSDEFMDYYENQHSRLSERMGRSPSIPNAVPCLFNDTIDHEGIPQPILESCDRVVKRRQWAASLLEAPARRRGTRRICACDAS